MISNTAHEPKASSKPLRRDAVRNREIVLDAARTVFAEQGIRGGFDQIAKIANVGVGTVYRRFPDRDALFDALFGERIRTITATAEKALLHSNSWDALLEFVTATTEIQVRDRGLREVLIYNGDDQRKLTDAKAAMIAAVDRLVEHAREDGFLRRDVEGLDLAVIGAMLSNMTGPLYPDMWRRYLTIIMDGLRVERHKPSTLVHGTPTPAALGEVAQLMHGRTT